MPTYIAMLKWTPQGLQSLKQSTTRLDAARKCFESAGVKMKDFYMVTGQHDMIAILDAPDDVSLATFQRKIDCRQRCRVGHVTGEIQS